MIKLRMLIEKETLTFQPVTVPIHKPAENLENARYIYKETYSITVVPRRRSSFFLTFFLCIRKSSGFDTISIENQDRG